MGYLLTRQLQFDGSGFMIEISTGGRDYANPDMLVEKYADEGREFCDPREAVKTAFKIRDAWRRDEPDAEIGIGYGCTCGMTMPFDPSTDEELTAWANKEFEAIPACDWCESKLFDPDKMFKLADYPDERFCSEYCAEKYTFDMESGD